MLKYRIVRDGDEFRAKRRYFGFLWVRPEHPVYGCELTFPSEASAVRFARNNAAGRECEIETAVAVEWAEPKIIRAAEGKK